MTAWQEAVGDFIIYDPLGDELAFLNEADLKTFMTKSMNNSRNAGMLNGNEPVALR